MVQTPIQKVNVTSVIVLINIIYFLIMVSTGLSPLGPQADQVLPFGANFGAYTVQSEWWRLLTSTFIHFGIFHLGMNMWCLWNLGKLAERMFGSRKFLVTYIVSGLGGGMSSLLWHPDVISAGASGAIFGIAGAIGSFVYRKQLILPKESSKELLRTLMLFVGVSLLFGVIVPGIDNAGHVGGLITGVLLGILMSRVQHFLLAASLVITAIALATPIATKRTQSNPQVLVTQALLQLTAGNNETALTLAEKASQEHPYFAPAQETLAILYAEERRFEDAITAASAAAELDPQSSRAQIVLAHSLHHLGTHERALTELKIAIHMEPKDIHTRILLSRSLQELDHLQESLETLEEAFKWEPNSAVLHGELGLAYYKIGNTKLAIQHLEEAISNASDQSFGYNQLALVLARTGSHDKALEAVQAALERTPDEPHILDTLGTVHWHRGDFESSVIAYKQAISLDPGNPIYHYNVSLALERQGKHDESNRASVKAFSLNPNLKVPENQIPII